MTRVGSELRAAPLTPDAALALGKSARALCERLLALPEERLARLRGVASRELLLVLGAEQDLPWSDGIVYLGREPELPELLLPCASCARVPPPLLLRALLARFRQLGLQAPCAVLLEAPLVVSLAAAQPLTRAGLLLWRQDAETAGAP
jgi:hypothetical protein